MFKDKLVEVLNQDVDYVWIHDYHLMVLPSMLRKQFLRLRCGLFLHSPFPSSEIFRTFPMREQILRSLLNADLIGAPRCPTSGASFSSDCCSRAVLGHSSIGSLSIVILALEGLHLASGCWMRS